MAAIDGAPRADGVPVTGSPGGSGVSDAGGEDATPAVGGAPHAGSEEATPEPGRGGAVHVVFMTAPAQDVAENVVRTLVAERLAACGNIVPGITSIYRWEGAVQRGSEVLVILKTGGATLDAMIRRAAALHPYEVPELLAVDVAQGFEPYVQWVGLSCE